MRHSTSKPTTAQQARLDAIHAMRCMICEKEDVRQPLRTEAHHLVDKGTRKHSGGHDATIPLCGWHHRGELIEGMSSESMRWSYGPSMKLQKKLFTNLYGTQRELLAETNQKLIGAAAGASPSPAHKAPLPLPTEVEMT